MGTLFRRSRSQSRGSLFAVGGSKNHPSTTSLDTPNSHPGSRRASKPSILIEPDPEVYGKQILISRKQMKNEIPTNDTVFKKYFVLNLSKTYMDNDC